jgi:hypothetical protein
MGVCELGWASVVVLSLQGCVPTDANGNVIATPAMKKSVSCYQVGTYGSPERAACGRSTKRRRSARRNSTLPVAAACELTELRERHPVG